MSNLSRLTALMLVATPVLAFAQLAVLLQGGDRIALVAPAGEISWEMPLGGIHDIHLLENDHIMVQQDMHGLAGHVRNTRKRAVELRAETLLVTACEQTRAWSVGPRRSRSWYRKYLSPFIEIESAKISGKTFLSSRNLAYRQKGKTDSPQIFTDSHRSFSLWSFRSFTAESLRSPTKLAMSTKLNTKALRRLHTPLNVKGK